MFDPAREELHRFAEVAAREFNDQAPFRATLSRLVNLYHRTSLPREEFAERFDAARQRTKERTVAIRMPTGETTAYGIVTKNKMPYFFAIFEELLGLREARPAEPDGDEAATLPAVAPKIDLEAGQGARPLRQPTLRRDEPAAGRSPALGHPGGAPPPLDAEKDGQVIKEVVRAFSGQFADCAAANALGNWAVTLWQRSGLSRHHFLEVAQQASLAMLHDSDTAPSEAIFQMRLTAELARLAGGAIGSKVD